MIRTYLGYVEISEMISRRLTKSQKTEILEAYRAGENTNVLAEKYSCTAATISRTVKTLLSDSEFKILKEKRSKVSNKNDKVLVDEIVEKKKEDLEESSFLISVEEKNKEEMYKAILKLNKATISSNTREVLELILK